MNPPAPPRHGHRGKENTQHCPPVRGLLPCSWPSQHQTILQILPQPADTRLGPHSLMNWGQWASGGAHRDFSGLPTILLQAWLRLVLGHTTAALPAPQDSPPAAGDSPHFPLTWYLLQAGATMASNKSEQRSQWLKLGTKMKGEGKLSTSCSGPESHTENFVNEMGRDGKETPKNRAGTAVEQKERSGTVSSYYMFQFCDWKSLKSIMQWILKPRKWGCSSLVLISFKVSSFLLCFSFLLRIKKVLIWIESQQFPLWSNLLNTFYLFFIQTGPLQYCAMCLRSWTAKNRCLLGVKSIFRLLWQLKKPLAAVNMVSMAT